MLKRRCRPCPGPGRFHLYPNMIGRKILVGPDGRVGGAGDPDGTQQG